MLRGLRFLTSPQVLSATHSITTRSVVTCVGRNNITARVIADSINSNANRLTTFELEYPRFIHAEFMTHRMLSKNAASSRAIPVPKMIANIQKNPAIPVHWGKNQRGMQANEETNDEIKLIVDGWDVHVNREDTWLAARDAAIYFARAYEAAGYHKQIVNRIIEPYKMMKVVCTGTEYDNFFWLRCHADAQPDIKELADVMRKAMDHSKPNLLSSTKYHLPYVTPEILDECAKHSKLPTPYDLALKVSASCCAQVSYRTMDTEIDKALRIYNQLVRSQPIHASPFEHQGRPLDNVDIDRFKLGLESSGLTHQSINGDHWSGNLRGWVQYRHEIPNNTCWNYDGDIDE
jgi:thymidylate synthase-like protein